MYEATLERRKGPLGLFIEKTPIGQIIEGQFLSHQIKQSRISLYVDRADHTLLIRVHGQPITVEFAAEPQRFWPNVVCRLGEDSEIISGRRKIAIYPEGDSTERLTLKAPKFQVALLTMEKAQSRIGALNAG